MIPEYTKGIRPEDMPDTIAREIAEVFGVELTLRLLETQGGRVIYFPIASNLPKSCQQENVSNVNAEELPTDTMRELAGDIGIHQAVELCKYFSGSCVYLPKLSRTLSVYRNRKIVEEYYCGESEKSLRRKYEITQSYIMRLVKEADKGGVQNEE